MTSRSTSQFLLAIAGQVVLLAAGYIVGAVFNNVFLALNIALAVVVTVLIAYSISLILKRESTNRQRSSSVPPILGLLSVAAIYIILRVFAPWCMGDALTFSVANTDGVHKIDQSTIIARPGAEVEISVYPLGAQQTSDALHCEWTVLGDAHLAAQQNCSAILRDAGLNTTDHVTVTASQPGCRIRVQTFFIEPDEE